jgi:hypothetical protein
MLVQETADQKTEYAQATAQTLPRLTLTIAATRRERLPYGSRHYEAVFRFVKYLTGNPPNFYQCSSFSCQNRAKSLDNTLKSLDNTALWGKNTQIPVKRRLKAHE